MKKFSLFSFIAILLIQSCQSPEPKSTPVQEPVAQPVAVGPSLLTADPLYSLPIPIDTANRMIQSYLTSVNAPTTNNFLRSLIVNADTLRNYVNDTSNGKIASVKLILSHQLSWINTGHYGQSGTTRSKALTLILVGLDENGRYVYNRNNMVYEHMQPCPYHCPENNQDLLTQ